MAQRTTFGDPCCTVYCSLTVVSNFYWFVEFGEKVTLTTLYFQLASLWGCDLLEKSIPHATMQPYHF